MEPGLQGSTVQYWSETAPEQSQLPGLCSQIAVILRFWRTEETEMSLNPRGSHDGCSSNTCILLFLRSCRRLRTQADDAGYVNTYSIKGTNQVGLVEAQQQDVALRTIFWFIIYTQSKRVQSQG